MGFFEDSFKSLERQNSGSLRNACITKKKIKFLIMKINRIIVFFGVLGILVIGGCDKKKPDTSHNSTTVSGDSSQKEAVTPNPLVSDEKSSETTISAAPATDNVAIGKEKIGYLNSALLLEADPEAKAIEKKLETLFKGKEAELENLGKSAQNKMQSYQENAHLLNETERKSREEELIGLDQQLQKMQYDASNEMERKRQELLAPVLKKMDKAVKQVAKENGYTYVLDPSAGGIVFADTTRDLLPLVKAKLGLKK